MKILFILPYDNTYRYKGSFKRSISYAPLTLSTLAALVPQGFCETIDLIDEGVQKPAYDDGKPYDLVGITCVASSSLRAYSLADYWRSRGAYVVMGGVHPTLRPEEACDHADTVVVGLAEESFPQFLADFRSGKPQRVYRPDCNHNNINQNKSIQNKSIQNKSIQNSSNQNKSNQNSSNQNKCNHINHNQNQNHNRDHNHKLLSSPIPRRELMPKGKYISIPTVIANRGCMNNCEFCSIPKLYPPWGSKRPIEEVIEEIRALKTREVLFLDPSPTSDKEYAKSLYRALIHLKINWAGLSTIDVVDDQELFHLMVKSGCEGILVGFESLSQANMVKSRKLFAEVGRYKEAVTLFHKHNLGILGCFVLGFDDDTREGLEKVPEVIDELGIDLPRYAVLTPFPGTDLFHRFKLENRILTEDWSLYDTEHVVFEPNNMYPEELQQILYKTWLRTYSLNKIIRRVTRTGKHKLLALTASFGFRYYAQLLQKAN